MEPEINERLERIESMLATLVSKNIHKEWYTTAEVAQILERSSYTVREWARLGRIKASKRACGHGNAKEWMVSHAELTRLRNEGLLPFQITQMP